MYVKKTWVIFLTVLAFGAMSAVCAVSSSDYADITVSNHVTGVLADKSKQFSFDIYFTDGAGSVVREETFYLKDGQSFAFERIPADWTVCVTIERDALYVPIFTDTGGERGDVGEHSTGDRGLNPGNREIAFENDRLEIVLTGIADIEWSDMAFVLMAGSLVAMCLASVFVKRLLDKPRKYY
jgi:hypothetical protein